MVEIINKTIVDLSQIGIIHNEALTVFQLLPKEESPKMSLALTVLSGVNSRVRNLESNTTYSVIAGVVFFIVWDEEDYELRELKVGESISIPANTWYQDMGMAVMVCKNNNAFDPSKVEFEK